MTRITRSGFGAVAKPLYNTVQAFNADESMLMLYHTGTDAAAHHLYDGRTYEHVRALDIVPRDLEQVFWHTTDPDLFFYISRKSGSYGHLIRYHVSTDTRERVRDLSKVCPSDGVPTAGGDVQMTSWDSDVMGLRCPNAPYSTFYYRISTDTLSDMVAMGDGTPYSEWFSMAAAPSGDRFFMNGDVLDTDLTVLRSLDVTRYSDGRFKPEHAVLGRLSNGHDAYFATQFNATDDGCDGGSARGVGHLVAYDMQNGSCRAIVGEDSGWGYPHSGTHPSSLAYERPGWVAMSSIGYGRFELFTNDEAAPPLLSEIYLVNTDPDEPALCRLAHARTYGKSATNGGYAGYFGEPHPVISPSGTRILFGSDWYDSGSVDTYVIELPSYER